MIGGWQSLISAGRKVTSGNAGNGFPAIKGYSIAMIADITLKRNFLDA